MKSHSCMFFLEGCVFCEYLASSFRDIRSLQDTNLSDHYAPQVPAITSTVRESQEAVAAAATPLEVAPKVEAAKTARVLRNSTSKLWNFTQGLRDLYHVMRFHVRCLKMTSPWLPSNWIASASVSGAKGWPLSAASCFASTSNWILRITLVVFAKDVFGIFLICFGHIFGIALLIPKVNYIASAWVSQDGSYLERWNLRTEQALSEICGWGSRSCRTWCGILTWWRDEICTASEVFQEDRARMARM